jgi:hypothetical protein
MKRFLSISAFLLLSAQISFAAPNENQDAAEGMGVTKTTGSRWKKSNEVRIQPQLGMVISTFVGSNTEEFKTRNAIGAGVLFDIGNGPVQLQTGLQYRPRGFEMTMYGLGFPITATGKFNYLSAPVYAKINLTPNSNSNFYFKGGGELSYLVDKEISMSGNGRTASVSNFKTNTVDLAPSIGLGVGIPVEGGNEIILEATYSRGLIKVIDETGSDWYNSSGSLTAGYLF